MQIRLHVRRFFCDTSVCGRATFTERLLTVAPLYARTTTRLRRSQAETGLALGGAAGARQLARQGISSSRNIARRRVRGIPEAAYPPPHVVGIDDWAWRKGRRCGTIVVDLEREIAFVRGVEHVWDNCRVQLNAGVIRIWHAKKNRYDYIVLVTRDQQLTAKWMIKTMKSAQN